MHSARCKNKQRNETTMKHASSPIYRATTLITILSFSLLFSACQPKSAETENKNGTTQATNTSKSESNSYQVTNKEVTQKVQGEPMKQLADFKEITATQVILNTNKGDITIELFRDETPITTANFLELADSGFYDGIRFHRIIEGFMAQVGDPLSKDMSKQAMWGTGGTDYVISDEFVSTLKHDSAGIVSMANRGPNTGGSQFFITYEPTPWLDGKHTVFGRVTAGMDVVEQLEIGDAIQTVTIE